MEYKMKKIVSLIITTMGLLTAQNQLYIPEAISGNQFDLTLQNGTSQLFDGMATETMGANGSNFAPTLIFEQGEFVNINVTNNLDEETTIHWRSEEHTSELQSRRNLVCRLLLEKNKIRFLF